MTIYEKTKGKNFSGVIFRSLLLLLMLLLAACSQPVIPGGGALDQPPSRANSPSRAGVENGTLFINLTLKSTFSRSGYSFALDEVLLVKAEVKDEFEKGTAIEQGKFKCTLLDDNKHPLKSVNIINSLIYRGEYADDSGVLRKQKMPAYDSVAVSLKTRNAANIKYLLIQTADQNGRLIDIELFDIRSVVRKDKPVSRANRFAVEKIVYNGPDSKKVVFAVLGDGYRSSEQNKFINDTKKAINDMFKDSAYSPYSSHFNVYAVKVISNVSGAANHPNNLIDNYFGSTFNYAGIERLLVPTKSSKVYSVARNHVPDYNQIIVLVNTSRYGGSGGKISTASTHSQSSELNLHELGHSFAGLSDEYWAGIQYAYENINMTKNNNPSTVRWREFLYQEGVGIYEHKVAGWYRPHQNCKMRFLGKPFCLVCKKAHRDKIKKIIGDINDDSPPAVPTGLKAINVGKTYFTADWNDMSKATGYDLQLWLWDGSNYSWQDQGSSTVSHLKFTGLSAGSTQYVRVRAKNSHGVSQYCSYATVNLK